MFCLQTPDDALGGLRTLELTLGQVPSGCWCLGLAEHLFCSGYHLSRYQLFFDIKYRKMVENRKVFVDFIIMIFISLLDICSEGTVLKSEQPKPHLPRCIVHLILNGEGWRRFEQIKLTASEITHPLDP
jgi:hypothetical protein